MFKRFFRSSTPSKSMEALKELIVKDTSSSDVVIYSKTYCPYCTTTKNLFQSNFASSTTQVFELDNMPNGSDVQNTLAQMTGQRTVPSVWVKGKHVGGNDDTHALFRSGKLQEMLS